jgi:hypothetical protein
MLYNKVYSRSDAAKSLYNKVYSRSTTFPVAADFDERQPFPSSIPMPLNTAATRQPFPSSTPMPLNTAATGDAGLAATRIANYVSRPRLAPIKLQSDYDLLCVSSAQPSTLEAKNNALRSLYHSIYHDALACSHMTNQLGDTFLIPPDNTYDRFVRSHRTYAFLSCELDIDEQQPQHARLASWLASERLRLLK